MTDQYYVPNDGAHYSSYHIDCPLHGKQPMISLSTESQNDSPFKFEFCFKCIAYTLVKQIKSSGGYVKKVRG